MGNQLEKISGNGVISGFRDLILKMLHDLGILADRHFQGVLSFMQGLISTVGFGVCVTSKSPSVLGFQIRRCARRGLQVMVYIDPKKSQCI